MSLEIQKIITNFIEYVNNNPYYFEKRDDIKEYHIATEILSKIYPLLKEEIGLYQTKV